MKAKVIVTLRKDVLDPQGKAIESALLRLGHKGVSGVRVGKYIEMSLENRNKAQATAELKTMCEKLLSNPVIEDARYELTE
jgi:phosphoribosylformylglycinamidine synthase subunit PurS